MLLDHVAWLVQGGDCKWCKTGDCWTHPGKGKGGGRNRSRSPRRRQLDIARQLGNDSSCVDYAGTWKKSLAPFLRRSGRLRNTPVPLAFDDGKSFLEFNVIPEQTFAVGEMAREKKGRIKRSHAQAKWKDMERSKHRPQFDKFVFSMQAHSSFSSSGLKADGISIAQDETPIWNFLHVNCAQQFGAILVPKISRNDMVKTCELLAGGCLLGLRRQVVQDPGRLCIVCTDGGWKLRSYGLSKPDASPDAPSKTSTHSVQISFPQWTRFV